MPFDKKLTLFIEEAEGNVLELAQKVTLGIHRDVVLGTRVDTGRARGNWNISVGQISNASNENLKDKTGGNTMSDGARELARAKLGQTFYVQNSIPYIGKLEALDKMAAMAFANAKLRLSAGGQ